ncbi:MAG: hypothetical protein KAJ51_08815, partial [Thermoplasmata archaeon]|nr:hypothetical protein [Thermoplasmata archaeon]
AVRDIDGQSFSSPPERNNSNYHYYYARDVEWYVVGPNLTNIDTVKSKLMIHGVIGTCLYWTSSFLKTPEYTFYQPPTDSRLPNHAVAIVGWNDTKVTQAPLPGAWLCKNSWGAGWGLNGYFWISYYDKHCGQHPEMGAVSIQGVQYLAYNYTYYYDYHGWRDTLTNCTEAFNVYYAHEIEQLQAVSFYTAADNVQYSVKIYDSYIAGELRNELSSLFGIIRYSGLHTLDLATPVNLEKGDDFYIYLNLSEGGHPFDCTSDVPVLLGEPRSPGTLVVSASAPGQSYFRNATKWDDLYYLNETANFCIKGLVGHLSIMAPLKGDYLNGIVDVTGRASSLIDEIELKIDDGSWQSPLGISYWILGWDTTLVSDGLHTIYVRGFNGSVVIERNVTVLLDNSNPLTTALLNGTLGNENWYLSDVEVNLTAIDTMTKIKSIKYRVDSNTVWNNYQGNFSVSGEGYHSVYFYSTDYVGNQESIKSITFKIDTIAPNSSYNIIGTLGNDHWYISEVNIILNSKDIMSGVTSTFYSINGGAWQNYTTVLEFKIDGYYTIEFYALDAAGNIELPRNLTFK